MEVVSSTDMESASPPSYSCSSATVLSSSPFSSAIQESRSNGTQLDDTSMANGDGGHTLHGGEVSSSKKVSMRRNRVKYNRRIGNSSTAVSSLPPPHFGDLSQIQETQLDEFSKTSPSNHRLSCHILHRPSSSPCSSSPVSVSGQSSITSSLNNIHHAVSEQHPTTIIVSNKRDIFSQQFRKVSINDSPVVVNKISRTNNNNGISALGQQQRSSLIQVSERKARKVRFFINSDKFFKGVVIAVSEEKFRTFDKLLEHLTRIMCNQVTLPNGVRCIFALDGRCIQCVQELQHGENYVCSSVAVFKKLDYLKMAQDQDHLRQCWKGMTRDAYCYLGMGNTLNGRSKRDAYKLSGHSKSFGTTKSGCSTTNDVRLHHIKPKIVAVLRSGLRPRKAVRVLLNHRNMKSLEVVLADITNAVKLDTGAVRKVFTLDGKPVVDVVDFADADVFVAYGTDKCNNDDFDLDPTEFRNVQSILKSPELDAKYEKYASGANSASPKTSRRKFLLSRNPVKRCKNRKSGSSKIRENALLSGGDDQHLDVAGSLTLSGNFGEVVDEEQEDDETPPEVAIKYIVGDVIGDGNFAIVRRCVSKRSRQNFALKIIDKSKCLGKEHMIESEIAILNLVSHPHIIELIEVFDFPGAKYLVTELVPGGDLFDSIAMDTKYTESVSRRMIADLTAALQYLHDRMIVHRDIKPENLLVMDLSSCLPQEGAVLSGEKVLSLKLGDFGLAQLVSEPLFTVCGTPTYVAPEILAETGYGVKVDVWATGVIMYILLVGYPPFSSRTNNQEELFDQILSGLFEFNSPEWDGISYHAKELISWMLQVDPLQRYSAYEILQHPWIKGEHLDHGLIR